MANSYGIKVTQEDINEGVRDQSAHCIVATAIGRQIPDATRISVDIQDIRFTVGEERLIFPTPRSVASYVIAFDAGDFDQIKPITVLLRDGRVAAKQVRGASRLIVKGDSKPQPRTAPSRTRAYGLRTFRVNQTAIQGGH